jgi:hypothetical protein
MIQLDAELRIAANQTAHASVGTQPHAFLHSPNSGDGVALGWHLRKTPRFYPGLHISL